MVAFFPEHLNCLTFLYRFPNGIKHLADFVHSHGMKLGIYGAVGPTTCMRFPGNAGHVERDANRYAEWGVDMLKLDGCFVPLDRLEVRSSFSPFVLDE